jgi:hypothetical protein
MAKNKETDNKNDNKEQKVVKKSSYSKKKKANGWKQCFQGIKQNEKKVFA